MTPRMTSRLKIRLIVNYVALAAVPGLLVALIAVAQQPLSGAAAEAIARAEVRRLGLDAHAMLAEWDDRNTSWKKWVGDQAAATLEATNSPCGYIAVHLISPSPSRLPNPTDPPGTIVITLNGGIFVLVDKCTGVVIDTIPVR